MRTHGATTPPLLTNVTLSRADDSGLEVLQQYSVGPEALKSGASSTRHVFVPMRHFYDDATYEVTLRLDVAEALVEWPQGAMRAPSVWEADGGPAEVNNVRR